MDFRDILEIFAAIATIIAAIAAVGGLLVAWQKRVFHNLHEALRHHVKKIRQEENNKDDKK